MAGSRRAWTENARPEWREIPAGQEYNATRILAGGNGTTPYAEVLAGTILEHDAEGKVRPCLAQLITNADAAATEFEVTDASCAFIGDAVDLVAAADINGRVTVAVGAGGAEIYVEANEPGVTLTLELNDPGGDGALSVAVTPGEPTHIVVTLAYAVGAVTTTVTELLAALADSVATPYITASLASGAGAELCIDVAETDLEWAALAGDVIGSSTIVAVDKDATPNTIEIADAQTWPANLYALVLNLDTHVLAGILEDQPNTAELQSGAIAAVDKAVQVARAGIMRLGSLTGYDATILGYLTGQVPAVGGPFGHPPQVLIVGFTPTADSVL